MFNRRSSSAVIPLLLAMVAGMEATASFDPRDVGYARPSASRGPVNHPESRDCADARLREADEKRRRKAEKKTANARRSAAGNYK
jgi:hypothetical protein